MRSNDRRNPIARRAALVASLALAASACASPGAGANDSAADRAPSPSTGPATSSVELRTDQTRYPRGATVGLTFVNHTDASWAFNPCTRTVEHEVSGAWQRVEEPGRMCTMIAVLLGPKATQTASTDLPKDLPAGRYRLVVGLTREGTQNAERTNAVSGAIDVGS